ncbi:cytochrome P450 [Pseudovirgaria hyperparasitica]|uniref:Cytochrome P450 n=1 Tax=Pseudovirgaria hyperparasitica TaxID=470096 RepID=A0A6A6VT12_9PEZI|nr:cytochrome P450 [Pseudovirgaria hyperparasitica]KAF2753019.1 cytochrome P450 [Pseudovirgaria hyperparasitica]
MALTTDVVSAARALSPLYILLAASFAFLSYTLYTYQTLAHIPGPFWARISNIPRFLWVWRRRAHEEHIALHRRYGPLVRMGPNMVSVGDPGAIAQIYGFSGTYAKSDFYHVILPMSKGRILPGLFATQDEGVHRMLKRPIAQTYSMSNLVSFEPYVDSTMRVFFEQVDRRFVSTGELCDLGAWLQMYAFDVIGEITFSKRLGFLEEGRDVDNIMGDIWRYFEYTAPVGMMPWIDRLWVKNPIVSMLRPAGWNAMGEFAVKRQTERLRAEEDVENNKGDLNSRDFLSRFIEQMKKDKSIPPWALQAWTQSNITAGSDTTAITLRTIIYNLLKHPHTMERLLQELDQADLSELVTWKQSLTLPYLDACIKEAGRIHPPFGLPYERVVPKEGARISGEWFKGGTVVGCSAWVVHRNEEVFGAEVDTWRPERWLDCDAEQRKKMENSLLTFGHGHRSCIGKNISYLEVYKLVPTLLKTYELELDCPNAKNEWRLENRWFVPQFDFFVRMKKRASVASEKLVET